MKSNCFLLTALLVVTTPGMAQKTETSLSASDKLHMELTYQLKVSNKDTGRARIFLALTNFHWRNKRNEDSVTSYAEKARALSRELKFDSGYHEATALLCKMYVAKKKMDAARNILLEVSRDQQARLLIVIGEGYVFRPELQKKDLDSAYSYFSQALEISRMIGSETWKHESLIALGKYYFSAGGLKKGQDCFMEIIGDFQTTGDSSSAAHIWSELGKYMPDTDSTMEDALFAHGQAIRIYHALKDTNNERSSWEDVALINLFHGEFNLAKTQFLKALDLRKAVNNKSLYKEYIPLSWIAEATGDLDEALAYALAADKDFTSQGITDEVGMIKVLLGQIYSDNREPEKSLQYFLDIKNTNDQWRYFICRKVVEQYIVMQQPEKALSFLLEYEKKNPAKRPSDRETLAGAKGDCYAALNKPSIAEKHYLEMVELDDEAQKFKSREVIPLAFTIAGSEAYHKIALFYFSQKKYKVAGTYLERALQAKSFSGNQFYTTNLMRQIWWLKFKTDSTSGNHIAAIQSFQKYTNLNDSMFNAAKSRQLQHLQVQYETEKKETDIKSRDQQIDALTKNDLLQKANLKQANFIRNTTIAGILVSLVLSTLIYRQYKQKLRANKLITHKSAELQHLLTEKEWLLKEVHHRVKNNLHTIICLLESQAVYLADDALKAVENSQHRVYAMSLIHQKLYQAENIKTVEMAEYLPEFIQYLKESFGISSNIVFELDIDPLELDVSRAMPIALIINEAVTNSIKYAFPQNRTGLIKVAIYRSGDNALLVIADNGIGIRENFSSRTTNSLGIQLIKGLSEDIKGHIRFDNDNGTKISIEFKVDPISANRNIIYKPEEDKIFV